MAKWKENENKISEVSESENTMCVLGFDEAKEVHYQVNIIHGKILKPIIWNLNTLKTYT